MKPINKLIFVIPLTKRKFTMIEVHKMPNPIVASEFIRNLHEAEWIPLLPGIRGSSGVYGIPPGTDLSMGADLIDMDPGTSFPLHTHPGAHILFILEGQGTVTIGDHVFKTRPGDCLFIPGNLTHGVGAIEHHVLLAVGFPHKQMTNPQRMNIVDEDYLQGNPLFALIYSGDDHEKREELLRAFQKDPSSSTKD